MPKLKAPLLSLDARGTLANNLTFARVRGATVAKTIPTHPDARTYPQFKQRLLFWAGIDHWHSLSSAEQAAYHTQGRPYGLTGYQYHQRQYLRTLPDIALWLHMDEQTGTESRDISAYTSHGTIFGATPVQAPLNYGLYFITDDYVEIPAAATQLNFTTGDFAVICRARVDALGTARWVFTRGSDSVDGWFCYIGSVGELALKTSQSGAAQISWSQAGEVAIDTWVTIGFSRDGASVRTFRNGVDVTLVPQSHLNPTTSARSAKIGIHDDKVTYPFDGKIDLLTIFLRHLTPAEHLQWHQRLSSFAYPW